MSTTQTKADVIAWLGPAAADATPEQVDDLVDAANAIAARYPVFTDAQTEREDALSGAAQVILGDDTLRGIADEWRAAAARAESARCVMVGAIIARSVAAGASDTAIADEAGVTRVTVAVALGKRRPGRRS